MGFDLYGISPDLTRPEPELPSMVDRTSKHWEIYTEWQKENCGVHFRNNVWGWRPLWHLVCASCGDILTDKDMQAGSHNGNHKISKTKAERISKRLKSWLKDGSLDGWDEFRKHAEPNIADYPFHIDNVSRFAKFCEHSGGFRIR